MIDLCVFTVNALGSAAYLKMFITECRGERVGNSWGGGEPPGCGSPKAHLINGAGQTGGLVWQPLNLTCSESELLGAHNWEDRLLILQNKFAAMSIVSITSTWRESVLT